MSLSSILSDINSTQRELASLARDQARYSQDRAQAMGRAADAQKAAYSTSSDSTRQSKLRDAQRYNDEAVRAGQNEAQVAGKIADKTKRLSDYQEKLSREQIAEAKKQQDSFKKLEETLKAQQAEADRARIQDVYRPRTTYLARGAVNIPPNSVSPVPEYDAFISHASEDKEEIVRPLADALATAGFRVWYDSFRLTVGDSLRRSIDGGLSRSRFGIVILSEAFFNKEWPQRELDGLTAKETAGKKVILPIWHKITKDRVMHYSPTLADKLGLNTSTKTVAEIVKELSAVLNPDEP